MDKLRFRTVWQMRHFWWFSNTDLNCLALTLQVWFCSNKKKLFWHLKSSIFPPQLQCRKRKVKNLHKTDSFSPLLFVILVMAFSQVVNMRLHLHAIIDRKQNGCKWLFFFHVLCIFFFFSDILFFDHDPQHKCERRKLCAKLVFWPRVANLSRS